MEAQLIERLALQAAAPAITILCPLDLRRPGNAEEHFHIDERGTNGHLVPIALVTRY